VADRYVIEESIGQGGMGRVYRAYDEVLHEEVAIKTLLPEFSTNPGFLTRFRDEVRLARRVAHPNVCRVHDYVDHEGTPFLSMEWVEGETLAARRRRLGAGPEGELQIVADDVTEALRALWSNGIVHRDLKPANLMWTRAGRVKVMDFGLARALAGEGERDRTSGVVGSPEYLSPEQIRGEAATEKSDTYAMGVTLFELATGHPPFRGDSPAQTLMKHLAEPPDPSGLASLSEPLRSMILRSLEKSPAARPDFRGPATVSTQVDLGPVESFRGTPSRTPAFVVSLASLVSIVAAVVYFGLRSPSVPDVSQALTPVAPPLSSPASSPSVEVRNEPTPAPSGSPGTKRLPAAETSPPVGQSPSPVPSIASQATPSAAPPLEPSPETNAPPAPVVALPEATPTKPPPTPLEARLVVVAIPWAEVFVDGDRVGLTPFPAIPLAPGPHVVELRHPDFRPYLRTIELKAGERFGLTVNLRLEAIRR
jgi:serine/threonine-protein kinase